MEMTLDQRRAIAVASARARAAQDQQGGNPGSSDAVPYHSWSEIGGNIIPDAINTATGFVNMVTNPRPMIDAIQGGVDRIMPQPVTDFLNRLAPRTPETIERQHEISGAVGQNLKESYGGAERIKNTIITHPVGSALDIASIALPALGVAGKGPLAARLAESPTTALDVGRPAVSKISEAIKGDAVTPQSTAALGPEGMLLDAGPNLARQGRGVFSTPGEGSQIVNQALEQRAQGVTDRALQAADDALGPRVNAVEQRARLKEARANAGNANYNPVFANAGPVNTSPAIQAIDAVVQPTVAGLGPDSAGAIGQRLLGYRKRLINDKQGQVIDSKTLQGVYQDVGDDIGAAVRAGRNNEARTLMNVKKALEGSIDDATGGGFSKANAQWAADSRVMEAYDYGENLARNSATPDEVAANLGKMKPEEHAQVLHGLRNWVYEVVGTARNDAAAARALLDRGWTREKLGMVLGKNEAQQLADRIGLEKTYAETDRFVRKGSNTTPGAMGVADVADSSILDSVLGRGGKEALSNAGIFGLGRRWALNAADSLMGRLNASSGNAMRADLAKLLTAKGSARDEIVRLLTDKNTMNAFRAGGILPQTGIALLKAVIAERALDKVNPARR